MEDFLLGNPTGIPNWVYVGAFILFVLNKLGLLDAMIGTIDGFINRKAKSDEAARLHKEELQTAKVDSALQASISNQMASHTSQAKLQEILESTLNFLTTDLIASIDKLEETITKHTDKIDVLINEAVRVDESARISHERLNSLSGITPKIAQTFDELKPHIITLSESNEHLLPVMGELEGAIRLLVERLKEISEDAKK